MKKVLFFYVLFVRKWRFVAPLCLLTKTSAEYWPLMPIKSPTPGSCAMSVQPFALPPDEEEEEDYQTIFLLSKIYGQNYNLWDNNSSYNLVYYNH